MYFNSKVIEVSNGGWEANNLIVMLINGSKFLN